ncbi:hypothetical protein PISMIDRAFT_301730 [Pisolithus microcarpus 441]|uniref:Uncharacterized protein n=1 Tax=Pisolithus microcarpus 441 TaxID=765257 RepID=A0A0D0AET0_9AGAM|nr:hypothetical protein PISMIDRAFT_301730 [Pisolithus microcarpus 441]
MRVHSPSTLMGGTLNARPTTLEDPVSPSSLRGYSNRSEYPRLPHDDIPYADAYHESMAGRGNPEDPIVINHSSRSMSQTPSDRTFENHRPAAFEYPGTRIIPPPPHHRQRDYVAAGAPTNIYGSHHHDAYPEARGIRRAESYRREPIRNHSKRGRPAYYIVPHGMDVVFQDGTGREIHRWVCVWSTRNTSDSREGLGISVGDEGLCLPHHLSCKTRVGEKYTGESVLQCPLVCAHLAIGTMGPTVHAVSPRYCKFT